MGATKVDLLREQDARRRAEQRAKLMQGERTRAESRAKVLSTTCKEMAQVIRAKDEKLARLSRIVEDLDQKHNEALAALVRLRDSHEGQKAALKEAHDKTVEGLNREVDATRRVSRNLMSHLNERDAALRKLGREVARHRNVLKQQAEKAEAERASLIEKHTAVVRGLQRDLMERHVAEKALQDRLDAAKSKAPD